MPVRASESPLSLRRTNCTVQWEPRAIERALRWVLDGQLTTLAQSQQQKRRNRNREQDHNGNLIDGHRSEPTSQREPLTDIEHTSPQRNQIPGNQQRANLGGTEAEV